jgi:hypothetical protein
MSGGTSSPSKVCYVCGLEKHLTTGFAKNRVRPDGRQDECRDCRSLAAARLRAAKKQQLQDLLARVAELENLRGDTPQ